MCHLVTLLVGGVTQDFFYVKSVPWLKKGWGTTALKDSPNPQREETLRRNPEEGSLLPGTLGG